MKRRIFGVLGGMGLLLLSGSLEAKAQEVIRPLENSSLETQTSRIAPYRLETINGKAVFTLAYDDGEPDVGYGPAPGSFAYDAVMRFDLGASAVTVEGLSVCLFRDGTDDSLDLNLTFWAPNGGGGSPGTQLASVAAVTSGVPNGTPSVFTYDLSALGISLPSGSVYIGVQWDASEEEDFFLCGDYDRSPAQPGYSRVNNGAWGTPPAQDSNYRSLMIRGSFDTVDSGPCDADATTLCLQGDRFAVEVDWRKPNGETGVGTAVELTPDTGYFWFFNASNVEMVVKVLNNCNGATNRFWVFGGGLTNVQVTMRVTDTQTGAVRTYINPQMTPFQPIQDTGAFATCP